MAVAPPLLWLGAPVCAMLLGLPMPVRRRLHGPGVEPLRQLTHVLADPEWFWVASSSPFWAWHVPALYDRVWAPIPGTTSRTPASSVRRCSSGDRDLAVAGPVVLAAMDDESRILRSPSSRTHAGRDLTFADHVIYRPYGAVPRRWDIPPSRTRPSPA